VHSAFSHAGQKCSATSLLLLEGEVYDDPHFKEMLCDAVRSLRVGSAWELHTRVNPLIRPPRGDLENGLKTLEPGESWVVRPEQVGDNPNLWSPGVKYGVQPGSYTHNTEFFGPVLGVMRFERLEEAIDLVNQTGYGLTSGLHSLDEREHQLWKDKIRAGNLYLNRGTTGAIVLRQPFGGTGKSCVGPGMKAGGPNYVAQFMCFEHGAGIHSLSENLRNPNLECLRLRLVEHARANSISPLIFRALASYDYWWNEEFSREHDHFRLLGQDNLRRYLPFREVRVRVSPQDSAFSIFARAAAGRVTGARVILSFPPSAEIPSVKLLDEFTDAWAGSIEFEEESDDDLAKTVRGFRPHSDERIRFAGCESVPGAIRSAAAQTGTYIADEPVLAEGRIELLWYLREQSVSFDYHRYGNLGARSAESRAEPV
jgi:RHH-type proline utilization regulon transcriptional repressor/proline dehydrogenase/delta 1-pyrroline-5-carboxylate dehydrogenase